jgi:hypothetical protein
MRKTITMIVVKSKLFKINFTDDVNEDDCHLYDNGTIKIIFCDYQKNGCVDNELATVALAWWYGNSFTEVKNMSQLRVHQSGLMVTFAKSTCGRQNSNSKTCLWLTDRAF